jgi:PncC family amidohydrolase
MIEKTIIKLLTRKRLTLSIAESCTGGLISHSLTNIPRSSKCIRLGIVAYANEAKTKLLQIPTQLIKERGAVSKEIALKLAQNVKHLAGTNIGLGITGIAGPSGGTKLKPIGTIFIAVSLSHTTYFKKFFFKGNRISIKTQAKDAALKLLEECL